MAKQSYRYVDMSVGIFMLLGFLALTFMVMKVSGVSLFSSQNFYVVSADFTNIGGLKVRAPVSVAGVKVGEVIDIQLQPQLLNAKVVMQLRAHPSIPFDDISARILTEGLLGSNYISIVPGFEDQPDHPYLRQGDVIAKTQEAMILENLIGQLLFNIKK